LVSSLFLDRARCARGGGEWENCGTHLRGDALSSRAPGYYTWLVFSRCIQLAGLNTAQDGKLNTMNGSKIAAAWSIPINTAQDGN
jgi:hypothetical protein